jgi:hypothetical protein
MCCFMKFAALLIFCALGCFASDFQIKLFTKEGNVIVENAFTNGIVATETAREISGPWIASQNFYSTNAQTAFKVLVSDVAELFVRAIALDLAGPGGFTNLIHSFSTLSTTAGAGGSTSAGVNKWRPEFENGPATNAQLSRPHIAMADTNGNIFIADKDAHGVRKVTPTGSISTVAGMSVAGNGNDAPTLGTQVALNEPNGLWVGKNGVVYILDLQNGKVRRLAGDGIVRTLFSVPGGIVSGRGLWVSDDESLAYVSSGAVVKKWTPGGGVVDFASGFSQLGNLVIDHRGELVVTDRNANRVYRIAADGSKTAIAGNGGTSGGGDGQLAIATALPQVRAVWFLPTGAFFVGTDSGARVWYIDTDGVIHLFLNGSGSNAHAGDGTWFYQPNEARTGPIRAITADADGNLLITEHDAGYVRKIEFQRR